MNQIMRRPAARRAAGLALPLALCAVLAVPASAGAGGPGRAYACRQDVHPHDRESPGEFVHVASITEAPNGDLLYAFYGGPEEIDRDKATFLSRMERGSKTWSTPVPIRKSADAIDGNPVIWHDGQGTIYLFFSTIEGDGWDEAILQFATSRDNGRTWSAATTLQQEWGWNVANRPLRMSNGEVILPIYHERGASGWIVSGDGFRTWRSYPSDPADWPTPGIQPATVELSPGHLLAFMRTDADLVYRTESFDYGRTWTPARPTDFPNRGARVDLIKLRDGNLVFAMNPVDGTAPERSPMRVLLSEDGGGTWPYSVDVETNRDDRYQYPYLWQSKDGYIHLGYTHTRLTKNMRSVTFNEEFVRSGPDIVSDPASGRRQYLGEPIRTKPVEYRHGAFRQLDKCHYVRSARN
ncbi:exo-alpha-sialidase [Actinomadura sp. 1N219]|uniref:exo-alpha-sialidase n=1 Tax=Actinomadura sp. 1N219 TaxID=3375152 RepID=UPI0037914320